MWVYIHKELGICRVFNFGVPDQLGGANMKAPGVYNELLAEDMALKQHLSEQHIERLWRSVWPWGEHENSIGEKKNFIWRKNNEQRTLWHSWRAVCSGDADE